MGFGEPLRAAHVKSAVRQNSGKWLQRSATSRALPAAVEQPEQPEPEPVYSGEPLMEASELDESVGDGVEVVRAASHGHAVFDV